MNTMNRERRSHAPRTFIEITPGIRRALEALADASIELLDEIDAPADGLEDGGDDEPSFGWSHYEAMSGRYGGGPDEGEEDDPAEDSDADEDSDPGEDGGDDEAEPMDADLTWPVTAGGMSNHPEQTTDDAMRMREAFDPRLARRPAPDDDAPYRPGVYPRFPHEPADREAFNLYGEIRRLRGVAMDAMMRKRWQRSRRRLADPSRSRPGASAR